MSRDIDDDFDDDFDLDSNDADDELLEDSKTKPLEKRLKIDAMLEAQRLNKLKKALEDGDDFAEFEDDFKNDLKELE